MMWLRLPFSLPGPKMTGVECVEGMASGLYEELFAAIVSLINRYGGLGGSVGDGSFCWGCCGGAFAGGSLEGDVEQAAAAC